ncbi:unnamed protein product [Amoebophrya sp. A120]|nr:unnamed protein product [Amoebophrya sp. A120]|eukprot:GSA120T00020384001.1
MLLHSPTSSKPTAEYSGSASGGSDKVELMSVVDSQSSGNEDGNSNSGTGASTKLDKNQIKNANKKATKAAAQMAAQQGCKCTLTNCVTKLVAFSTRATCSSIFFPFVYFPILFALSLHVLWFAYDVRLFAIRQYGYVIHEFDPWFNYRATEHLELELRASYKQLVAEKKTNGTAAAAAAGAEAAKADDSQAGRNHFLDAQVVDLASDDMSADEEEAAKKSSNTLLSVINPYLQDTFAWRLTRKYFDLNVWRHAVVERFFKWFDHMVWFPLGRPVGTTIYPGMQLTAVAMYRTLKVTSKVGKQQSEQVITKLLSDAEASSNSTAPAATGANGELLATADAEVEPELDLVSRFVKNILYSCRTVKGKPRNCILRYQKIFKRVYASTSPLWGETAGEKSKKGKGKGQKTEPQTADLQWRPDRLFGWAVEQTVGVSNDTVVAYLDAGYTVLESAVYPIFSAVLGSSESSSSDKKAAATLYFNRFLQSAFLEQLATKFLGFSNKSWKEYTKQAQKEYKKAYQTISKSVSTNFAYLVYEAPQRLLATFTYNWTLTQVACHLPAFFGSIATLFVGLLAAEAVAQPVAHYDYFRFISKAATALSAMFFMSVIPAHAQRSVGGGFDNECIAIAPMVACGFFWCLALRNIETPTKVNTYSAFVQRLLSAFLAGCSHAFMAAGWGGYVFLINLVGMHAALLFLLERIRMYGTSCLQNSDTQLPTNGTWKALYEAYTLFFIVATYGAMLTPVVHWAPLCSLEQVLPLAVFVLFQLVKFFDSSLMQNVLLPLLTEKFSKNLARFFSKKNVIRAMSTNVVLLGIVAVALISYDIENSVLLKILEKFMDPLSGRVKALFGAHATKTGNPLIDSVSEHQPGNPAALWRMLDRTMYLAPVGVGFLLFDVVCLMFSYLFAALARNGRKPTVLANWLDRKVKQLKSGSFTSVEKSSSSCEPPAAAVPSTLKAYTDSLFGLSEQTPVATAGLYCMIFGIATYAFALKMARLMIFLGPTAPLLSAIAVGRVCQWILAPFRYLTVKEHLLGYDKKAATIFANSTGAFYRAEPNSSLAIEDSSREDVDKAAKTPPPVAKKDRNETPLKGKKEGAAASSSSTGGTTTTKLGPLSTISRTGASSSSPSSSSAKRLPFQAATLSLLSVRALVTILMVFRYGFPSHMEHFLGAGYNMIQYGLSHPQIVSTLQDGTLKDDYREAYLWIRDNTKEDARILSWWDYGYQLAGISKRVTVADGNTWNHEHLAFLGMTITSPVEESHIIMRHWADYVLVWCDDDLSKATHMARIANSVYKGHCYDKMCWQFGWEGHGQPSKMMANSFVYHATTGYRDGDPEFAGRYKIVFQSKHAAVRIFKIAKASQKSKRLGFDPKRWQCDSEGSWYCPGDYAGQLAKLREIGFHGFGWTITGAKAEESKKFTVTTTTTVAGQKDEDEEDDEDAKGKGKGAEVKKKLKEELGRYFSLYHDRVSGNLALGPQPNGKLLPGGSYLTTSDGCKLVEGRGDGKTELQKMLGIKKTLLVCTHCESRPGHLPRQSNLELSGCPLLLDAVKIAKKQGVDVKDKEWIKTTLKTLEVDNIAGQLRCRARPHGAGIPPGGYQGSCVTCTLKNSQKDLHCEECAKSDGTRSSNVKFTDIWNKCQGSDKELQNHDGKIVCGSKRESARRRGTLNRMADGPGEWSNMLGETLESMGKY